MPAFPDNADINFLHLCSLQVAAAIAAKDALQAAKDVRTLIAVDDYNVLYWQTGAETQTLRVLLLASAVGWHCAQPPSRASPCRLAALLTTMSPLRCCLDIRPRPPPLNAGYYEAVHNFHRRQLAPDELRLVRLRKGRGWGLGRPVVAFARPWLGARPARLLV